MKSMSETVSTASNAADAWTNPLRDPRDLRLPRIAGPCSIVIFGVTGDLSRKKLLPAIYDLANACWEKEGIKVYVKSEKPVERHRSDVYARLVEAGKRLMLVITHNEGGTNKDLTKFMNQIHALCDKWDR